MLFYDLDKKYNKRIKEVKEGKTVIIDAKITKERPIPVETLKLDPSLYTAEEISAYKEKYEAEELVAFNEFLKAEGLTSKVAK